MLTIILGGNDCQRIELFKTSNTKIEGSRINLPLCREDTTSIALDLGSRPNLKPTSVSLFPSPLTCASIEDMASSWSREEKDQCVDATAAAFIGGGGINAYLSGGRGGHH